VLNGYPDIAVRTGQQGTNVVTFYLHPNGDISGLRLLRPMGYEALDKNTLEVIRIAYKDYPRPKEKTKITFFVTYRLY
jgi:protein TonB